jgi:NADH dehydrogenase FAD-containing subunit
VLSLDVGSAPDLTGAPSDRDRVLPAKPIGGFAGRLAAAEARLPTGRKARVAVAGGGLAGVELALALRRRYVRAGRGADVALVERGPQIAPGIPERVRRRLLAACAAHDVAVATGGACPGVDFDIVVWATGAAAPAWLEGSGLALDDRGFVRVDPTLRSLSHDRVFAAGDVAALADPRPKAGVFAVRQGPVLAENLRRHLATRPLHRCRPQERWLSLVATGPRHAIAIRGGLAVEGRWVWRWKDWIDRPSSRATATAERDRRAVGLDASLARPQRGDSRGASDVTTPRRRWSPIAATATRAASSLFPTWRCGGSGKRNGSWSMTILLRRFAEGTGRSDAECGSPSLPRAL